MINMPRAVWWAGMAALSAAALPSAAHHSFAMFDQKKIMTLGGTVHQFQWTNPHAFIELDVVTRGRTQRWSIELNSPNNLTRQGWRRSSLKSGETIAVRIAPLRNGHAGGLFLDLRKPDGTVLDSGLPKDGTAVNAPSV